MPAALWLLLTLAAGLPIAWFAYHLCFQNWYRHKISGDRYFSLPLEQRLAFHKKLKKHSRYLLPFYHFMAKGINPKRIPCIRSHGICIPSAIADESSIDHAVHYTSGRDDIFVATFMRSGTTWMQNIVFELLHHGKGDFSDKGYHHLYAISPWIECSPYASVSMEQAPRVSDYQKRIIKTHLPTQLCPLNQNAKYIYVARHPVDTFDSCVDFFNMLMGPFCPDKKALLDLFCSNDMLWGSWPDHLSGWWELAQKQNNVFFIRYEELRNNTMDSLHAIADFLGLSISHAELKRVEEKVSFESMQQNDVYFEMSPPNIFSVSNDKTFLAAVRERKPDDDVSRKIVAFCQHNIPKNSFPFDSTYH